MNALELAELLEAYSDDYQHENAANMLRQQHAEIEALKLQIKGYQQSTKYYRELHEGFSTIQDKLK